MFCGGKAFLASFTQHEVNEEEDEDSRFYLLVCLSDGKPSAGPEMGKLLMENTRFESRDWDWALHLSRS